MADVNPGSFADRLRSLMYPGEKQIPFAERIGTTQSSLNEWLTKGVIPRRANLEIVAQKLDVRPQWLLKGKGPRGPYPLSGPSNPVVQKENNVVFAEYLDVLGASSKRYEVLCAELVSLIQDCDERKARYMSILDKLETEFEQEVASFTPTQQVA